MKNNRRNGNEFTINNTATDHEDESTGTNVTADAESNVKAAKGDLFGDNSSEKKH